MSALKRSALYAAVAFGAVIIVGRAAPVRARTLRPLFEPTDLEMEDVGVAEVDLQVGGIRSAGPWRVVVPDFEVDVGILPNLELDVDGAYAVEGPASGPFSFDHAAPDSLWPSLKVGLFDGRDVARGRALAAGLQAGPKLPVAAGAHGIGFEGLLLVGMTLRRLHGALNIGGFAEPAAADAAVRPKGFEVGVDLGRDFGGAEQFSVTGELSAVRFTTGDPAQLLMTAGVTWSPAAFLDLSAVGLLGILDGSDRYGLLLGVSPRVRLFGGAPGR